MWDFFLNKFIKTSYASPVQWRFTMASHLDERNFRILSRWGSSCFEDGKSGDSSSPSWVPFSCTRKHQWAVFSSCVNWLVNLSNVEGNTNENVTWKYNFILFMLLIGITLTRLTSTEMANYPVTKLVGVVNAEIKKTEWKICRRVFMFSTKPWIWSFHFDVLQRMTTKCNKIWNTCAKLLFLLIKPFVLWRFHCCRCCHCTAS